MSSQVHVVIIGASFAGIPIAHSLLKDIPTVKVTLINPSPTFYFTIAAPAFSRSEMPSNPNNIFFQSKRSSADTQQNHSNLSKAANISFDYLVIASGSTTASTSQKTAVPIPFKQSDSDDMKSMIHNAQDSIRMAESIVIAGAGPIGVEVAGEIAEAARQSGRKVKITLVSASYRILPMLKPAGSAAAEKLLTGLGVEIVKNQKVAEAVQSKESHLWTVTLDEGRKLDVDLYIPTTGVLPNNDFIPADLLDENGWVVVDKELRVKTRRGSVARLPIFAAGDITNNSMRLSFKAQEQAAIVAANLKAEIVRQGKTKTYDQGDKTMMVVPVGSTGGTGLIMGWTPWSAMVKMVKGKDFFISKAHSAVSAK
ncbi:hypothetical protein N7530_004737 [Penicillium desertorum]|uniref:FAD/NAD(P)-binding domain-containing protein n=1 Tax=Penicillium desertorum TaxID=1303715 RepID=A0A9X0BQU0_9EURO|nr:hypothetical protein N7530_004737 [Penicillium desertorum]